MHLFWAVNPHSLKIQVTHPHPNTETKENGMNPYQEISLQPCPTHILHCLLVERLCLGIRLSWGQIDRQQGCVINLKPQRACVSFGV